MADRSNLYVVSLIALVAVVGIVTLFMNNAEAPAPVVVDEGGNIVGEAFYKLPAKYRKGIEEPMRVIPVPRLDLQPAVCSGLEECGYVQIAKLNRAQINTLTNNPELLSCDNICQRAGKTCVGAYLNIQYATGDEYRTVLNQWAPETCASGGNSNPIKCRCY